MLKHRIIPILTINGAMQVVKTIKFQRPYRIVGNLMQYIKIFERRQIDELCILDLDATLENRLINYEKIKEFTKELYCPLTLGGGIKTLEDINKLLQSGADKICIDSLKTDIMIDGARKFGKQAIVASACYGKSNKGYNILYWPSRKEFMPMLVPAACQVLERCQAGEILLTSIDRDGTYEGCDIDIIKSVAGVCKVPIVANSGLSSVVDASEALKAGAHAVAGSSIFLFTDMTPNIMAQELNKLGHQMRIQ